MTETYQIPFTQYLMPNGEKRPMMFETQREDVFLKAEEIRKNGFHFECEVLGNGAYSGTIGDNWGDYGYALVMDSASPLVQSETEKMILEFDIAEGHRLSEEAQ